MTHIVKYRTESGGSAPLTLGQDNMVRCIERDRPEHMNKQAIWPVPAGTAVDAVLDALRTLAERHPALRTVFPGDHYTVQQELAEGEFPVAVVAVPAGGDPDRLGEELGRLDRLRAFDLAVDFPLRFTLLTVDDRPVRLVVVICHAQIDGASTALLFREWLLLAAGEELPEPASPGPREIAEQEGSAAGQRRARSALRHWERILREDPLTVFADDRVQPSDDRLPTLLVRSPAGAVALERAVRRTGASPSTLLLAVYAALVAHLADQRTLVVATLAANRNRAALAGHIGTLAQDALLSVEVPLGDPAADFDALLGHSRAASLAGYWHSSFDAQRLWALIDEVAHDRGARYVRHMVLNDLSSTVPDEAVAGYQVPTEDPEFVWLPAENTPTRIMLDIWRLRGEVALSLHLDPQLFPRETGEQLARALLRLIEVAGERSFLLSELPALTGLPRARRDRPGWRSVGGTWIELAAVAELVREAVDAGCEVSLDGGELTAVIELPADPARGPAEVHAAVVAALPRHHTAIAPQRYVLHSPDGTTVTGSGR
ncbi:condensation domain-containing protein [Kitasatospora sp. NPDC058965]|uniref:condensation domain-containing protein n=1 Tax=Kitasatospora sp. NPDC058965 TaxID=3346682 RepID=UPI00368E63CC